jgi:hypothetical protein
MTVHRMTSYREALDRSRGNPYAEWPERENSARLEPIANPSFDSGVKLKPGAKVVTMGSCFARNIEEYFEAEGFDVPLMGYSAPIEEFGQGAARIQGILNKYTLASIATEVEWLAKVKAEGGTVSWDNIGHMLMEVKDDRFIDMQLSTTVAVSRERAIERRQHIYDIHVQIFDCDLAVLTPGLTETWFDTKTGHYIQRAPGPRQAKLEPDRFTFGVMDFFQCFEMLDKTIRILKDNGTRQIALTVSPVPLHRTMTGQDVLIANTYSKSTLRAVVGVICDRHEDVFYVPSYERVMLSKDESIWNQDLRHVADEFVGTIASRFAAAALGRPLASMDHVLAFELAVQEGRLEDAVNALDALGARAAEVSMHTFVKSACGLYIALGRWEDALPLAKRLEVLKPQAVGAYKLEFQIQRNLDNEAAALDAANRAVANCKDIVLQDFLANIGNAEK